MKSAAFFWLVLLVVFLIAEAACPIHLVSIWFALGALVALLCAALGAGVAANHAVRGGVRRSAGAAVAAGKEIPEFQGHGHQCGLRRRLRWPRHGGY